MSIDKYHLAPDCANCGQKDAIDEWKGGRMWASTWGHDMACCSEACGIAYATSVKRLEFELAGVRAQIAESKREEKQLLREIAKRKKAKP